MRNSILLSLIILAIVSSVTSDDDLHPNLKKVLDYIDGHTKTFIKVLREMVAIKTVSANLRQPAQYPEFGKMADYVDDRLKALGFTTEIRYTDKIVMTDGHEQNGAPVILGVLGNDKTKPTLLVYGHLDVQPAEKSDGWDEDPFILTEKSGNLIGRGATDDKGPALGWLNAVQAYVRSGVKVPVNIKIVFEMMEESGGGGLEAIMIKEKDKHLSGVDAVTISDSYWSTTEIPALTYGLRGMTYYQVEITGGVKDLHSGQWGGMVHEPMWDLIYLLDQLIAKNGTILIPGIMEDVDPLTPEEEQKYKEIDINVDGIQADGGVNGLLYRNEENVKELTLMHKWRYPSLSIHGIEGAFCGSGSKTVIPYRVRGKFSIRLVTSMVPDKVEEQVKTYLEQAFRTRNTPNRLKITTLSKGRPWKADSNDWNYRSAATAVEMIYKVKPQLTREGGSIPVTLLLQELTGKSVLLLPMGQSNDGQHSQNEKISRRNYIEGTKVFATYMWQLANNFKKT